MNIGCSCVCSIDGDLPTVSDEHWPRARKEHTCCECGGIIKAGQRYERVQGLWDGSWDTFKTCETCVNIRTDVCCGSYEFGQLREVIWDVFGVDYVTGALWGEDE